MALAGIQQLCPQGPVSERAHYTEGATRSERLEGASGDGNGVGDGSGDGNGGGDGAGTGTRDETR